MMARDAHRRGERDFRSDGRSAQQGFTLIELLVALMIFAMLASAGVLLLGNSVSAQAQVKARLDDMAAGQRAGASPGPRRARWPRPSGRMTMARRSR